MNLNPHGNLRAFTENPGCGASFTNFGNQVTLHGGLPQITQNLNKAMNNPARGDLQGMERLWKAGLQPRGIRPDGRAVLAPECPDLNAWVAAYARRRYGRDNTDAAEAWRLLLATAYQVPGRTVSDLCMRPSLDSEETKPGTKRDYDVAQLARACSRLLAAADTLGACDAYRYDAAHVLRQVLSDLAVPFRAEIAAAYHAGDRERLTAAGQRFIELLRDTDELLATRGEFLLGRWIADARKWGRTEEEKAHYEWNARNQITLWGPADSPLNDYAAKQWSGLTAGFYLPRWQQFLQRLDASLQAGTPFDAEGFEKDIRAWEAAWTRGKESYPDNPSGDTIAVAQRLWAKYGSLMLAGTP